MKRKSTQAKGQQLLEVMQEAISEEIEHKRKLGHPIVIWKDGKIVVGKVEEVIPDWSYHKKNKTNRVKK